MGSLLSLVLIVLLAIVVASLTSSERRARSTVLYSSHAESIVLQAALVGLWVLLIAKFAYHVIEPLWNATIRAEYESMTGGIPSAIVMLAILHVPYAVILLYLHQRARARRLHVRLT